MNQANEVCNLEMQSLDLYLITYIPVLYVTNKGNEGNRDDIEI